MISLIIPTRNRAYALQEVLPSFFEQPKVSEIIFIDDQSEDDTFLVITHFQKETPLIKVVYCRNEKREGASYSREKGVKLATNEYILFCDDDEFLGPNYCQILLSKILENKADIVSGRHFYRLPNENILKAIARFGKGINDEKAFDVRSFKVNTDAYLDKDTYLPFTHGIFLVSKKLLQQFGIDPYYRKGNGFREESDFQMRAYIHGHRILVTNDAHCVHMNMSEVRSGGQRVNRLRRFYWTIFYTSYFYSKYFNRAAELLDISYSKRSAILLFSALEFNRFFIRPFFILFGKLWNRFEY